MKSALHTLAEASDVCVKDAHLSLDGIPVRLHVVARHIQEASRVLSNPVNLLVQDSYTLLDRFTHLSGFGAECFKTLGIEVSPS